MVTYHEQGERSIPRTVALAPRAETDSGTGGEAVHSPAISLSDDGVVSYRAASVGAPCLASPGATASNRR